MFVLKASNGKFYSGRAGSWGEILIADKAQAFTYGREYAVERAAHFNKFTSVHGFTFTVEAV